MPGVGTHLAKLADIPIEQRIEAFRSAVLKGDLDPDDPDYWLCIDLVLDPGDTSGRVEA